MIQEIQAKSILNRNKYPSQWFGIHYGMNIYRGCTHGCIYCDSRSECYQIKNFDDIIVKINAPELLKNALQRKRKRYTIGTGAMSDPYIPIEKNYKLTRQCLDIIEQFRFRVHISTKSNLILRDIDLLSRIAKRYASVAFTITTLDEKLASIIEPNAPSTQKRLEAMGILSEVGVDTGILLMPQLPFIMEDEEQIKKLVEKAHAYGAKFIIPSFGMTLRDRQRAYYYQKLDEHFDGISSKYKKKFGNYYMASCINYKKLKQTFLNTTKNYNILTKMPSYEMRTSVTNLNFTDYNI